ncbi:DUF1045 domain-containing protein [Caballeronia sp. GAFFF2]|uniref:DUF1045 domain-containing protein n=1 Tax=Caballeronia sp. GAFFF2 TaxID=2921741 RepID=UPI002029505E|nr:DUF1045 domain-containing protein [Caballeronia sp. GAFFF2]
MSAAWSDEARIALYYAPPAASAWWRAGCEWLGRDAESGLSMETAAHDITRAPRRYGWHATIVPPFHCASGVQPADVLAAARAWASSVTRFEMPVRVAEMGRFVALRASEESDDERLRAMAASALQALAAVRAMPSAGDSERRIVDGMSERQIALVREWGYPYVFDEYRFHMTVCDSLDDTHARGSVVSAWTRKIDTLGALPVHGAALFVESAPGEPFTLWQRLPFNDVREGA